jgi:hypothetical protein
MKIKFVTMTAAVLLTAGTAMTQTTVTETTTTTTHVWTDPGAWWGSHWVAGPADRYTANELSLDFFGSYLAGQRAFEKMFDTNIRHGKWGGGVGANYFFTRNIGIGGDINIPDDGGNFINNVNGSLIARVPIGNSGLAPYIFGGGGRQTDPSWEWTGHLGVGLEYRFNAVTGIFVDDRYTWVKHTPDQMLFRAGLRFVF